MEQEKKKASMAYHDFWEMIERSWTWERLTIAERRTLKGRIWESQNAFRGSYDSRMNQLQFCYNFFLYGLGYKGLGWRAPEEWSVEYEDGEEVGTYASYDEALYQAQQMWANDHVKGFVRKVDYPKF